MPPAPLPMMFSAAIFGLLLLLVLFIVISRPFPPPASPPPPPPQCFWLLLFFTSLHSRFSSALLGLEWMLEGWLLIGDGNKFPENYI
jgi:uncharacterized membrane protein YfcA